MTGLDEKNMLVWLRDDELVWHNGERLLNGAFGVTKGDVLAANFDLDECDLRLILYCIPTNSLQLKLRGEIDALPLFTMWAQASLLWNEVFLFSGEDQTAAYFLYFLVDE